MAAQSVELATAGVEAAGEVVVPMNKVIDRIHVLYQRSIGQLVADNAMLHAALRVQEERVDELETLVAALTGGVPTGTSDDAKLAKQPVG